QDLDELWGEGAQLLSFEEVEHGAPNRRFEVFRKGTCGLSVLLEPLFEECAKHFFVWAKLKVFEMLVDQYEESVLMGSPLLDSLWAFDFMGRQKAQGAMKIMVAA